MFVYVCKTRRRIIRAKKKTNREQINSFKHSIVKIKKKIKFDE